MTPQEAAKEELVSNVIILEDWLKRRRAQLMMEIDSLYQKAVKVSKKPDPREDPFAGVIMKIIEPLAKQLERVEGHLKFLRRSSGQAVHINPGSYTIQYHPSINMKFNFNNPSET